MKPAAIVTETVTPAQMRKMTAGIKKEIRHYERCARMLKRVDATVFAAGMELFDDEEGLALWLCAPAHALEGELPLQVLRTARGRRRVAHVLRAIAYGVCL